MKSVKKDLQPLTLVAAVRYLLIACGYTRNFIWGNQRQTFYMVKTYNTATPANEKIFLDALKTLFLKTKVYATVLKDSHEHYYSAMPSTHIRLPVSASKLLYNINRRQLDDIIADISATSSSGTEQKTTVSKTRKVKPFVGRSTIFAEPSVKALPKSQVYKLLPGSWLEVQWKDSPPSMCLLLERFERCSGDSCADVVPFHGLKQRRHDFSDLSLNITHGQVVGVLGHIVPPPCRVDSKHRMK